jgi:N-methylhydantoinase A
MTPEVATERPVAMMESGPVGGIIASAQVGIALGFQNVISFDMGGTTAKASLIRAGEPTLAPGYYVGGYASGHPVMLPMIDVVEVGAGGGSIAWRDDIGALKVGPQSAGAEPGPICYGAGGAEPTITDANVVLGRLDPNNFLGGTMKLDAKAARRGIKQKIAGPLKLDVIAAAQAIVDIAVNKMSLAVREVSVAKGYDPRDFALVASGGAGPLHVCAIALGRRAPRLHPHGLFGSGQRRFQASRRGARRDGEGRHGQPAAQQERETPDPSRPALHGSGVHAAGAGDDRAAQEGRAQGHPHGVRRTL